MNKNIVLWLGALVLAAAPAVTVMAQEGPGAGGPDEGMAAEAPAQPDAPAAQPPQARAERGGMGEMARGHMGRIGEMGEPRPGMGGPVMLSEEETMTIITRNDPAFAKKITDLKTVSPAKYRMLMMMSRHMLSSTKMDQDAALEEDAVAGLSLDFETKELAQDYNKAADADKKAIKDNLRVKLAALFDLKLKEQEQRVKHMDAEITRLKSNLETRKANKDKIVGQRLDEMTGQGFGW
jgi:uncharacterized small protein (DUF1192 family)